MAKPVESAKPCVKCGQTVVKCESKNGKFYIANIDIVSSQYADYGARGKAIYRAHDCNEHEICSHLNALDGIVRLRNEFYTSAPPFKWMVWPHSKSNGWLTQIVHALNPT